MRRPSVGRSGVTRPCAIAGKFWLDKPWPRLLSFSWNEEQIDGLTARVSGREGKSVMKAIEAAKQDIDPMVRAAARKLDSHIQKAQQHKEKSIGEPDSAAKPTGF